MEILPVADGGDGLLDVLLPADGKRDAVQVTGPLGRPVTASIGWLDRGTAAIESASACGLALLGRKERDPLRATTRGVGELMRAAVDRGARLVVVGLGGSATVDGGTGLARALGWRFQDRDGRDLLDGGALTEGDYPVDYVQLLTDTHAYLQGYYRAFLAIRDQAIPTIAAVNGPAVGAGLNLALACGIRIAGSEATFGATFARIGLHPGGGCTHFLVEALGPSRALRTLLLGDTLDAHQAVAWGLAEGPEDDPLAAALDLGSRFAQLDSALARHIVKAVRLAASTRDLDAVLEYESWAQAASASSPTLQAWVERFREQ